MENSLNKVISKETLKDSISALYENGLPKGSGIGLKKLDESIRWETGRLNVITGIPNYGKSEFLDFINVQLNKLYRWKVVYFSPENHPLSNHISKLVSKILNKRFDKNVITNEELNSVIEHIGNNFFWLNPDTVNTIDDILDTTQELIIKEGIKILSIDPYNCLEHLKPNNMLETEYISLLLDKITKFARKNNILIHLIVHPRKMEITKGLNNIAYLGRSCSGKGLFGIIPVTEKEKHLEHFLALEKDFLNMNIILDKSCKDITRLRFYSYDNEAYYNLNAEPYANLLFKQKTASNKQNNSFHYNYTPVDIGDKYLNMAIKDIQDNHINITETYQDWRDIGIILNNEFGEEGRQIYHVISSQSSQYNQTDLAFIKWNISTSITQKLLKLMSKARRRAKKSSRKKHCVCVWFSTKMIRVENISLLPIIGK